MWPRPAPSGRAHADCGDRWSTPITPGLSRLAARSSTPVRGAENGGAVRAERARQRAMRENYLGAKKSAVESQL
jgi:hypothetical protein